MKALPIAVVLMCIALLCWSYFSEGIAHQLADSNASAEQKIDILKSFFLDYGAAAPLVYITFVTIEVVIAPLPGLMLYIPGGIVFGWFLGGLYSLIGNVLGAGIACALTRHLGQSTINRFVESRSLGEQSKRLSDKGFLLIILLRINPLTSTDLVSYAAGFTQIPIHRVMLATGIGIAPLCWAQSYLADGLLNAFPKLLYPLLFACIIYAVCVVLAIRKMLAREATDLKSTVQEMPKSRQE